MRIILGLLLLVFMPNQIQAPCAIQIGDSLTVGAAPYLTQYHVRSNGVVGRQWLAGADVARSLRHQGLLPRRVIVELGTNGPIGDSEFQTMLHMIGPRRIVFVTPYGPRWWIPRTATFIASEAHRYGFGVLRWDHLASGVGPDGIHLTPAGYRRFAYLTSHAIGCAA